METKEIKSNFHSLIDKIDNAQFLINFYELMDLNYNNEDELNESQESSLRNALKQSEDPDVLIPHNQIFKK